MPVKQEKPRLSEKTNPAAGQPLRKVQFGAITKKKPDARATYPVLPDPQGQYAAIAARIIGSWFTATAAGPIGCSSQSTACPGSTATGLPEAGSSAFGNHPATGWFVGRSS